jgi:hypothetical protein
MMCLCSSSSLMSCLSYLSPFSVSKYFSKQELFILTGHSGLVWAIPDLEQETAYRKSRVPESLDAIAWPNCHLHYYPGGCLAVRPRANLVGLIYRTPKTPIADPLFRYIPPKVKYDKSNIKNSDNTALFLTSLFEYIFIGVVMSAGRPFRQPMTKNCK